MPYASELKNSPHAENGPNVIVIVLSVTVVVAVTGMGALQRNQPTEPALHLPLLQQTFIRRCWPKETRKLSAPGTQSDDG